MSGAKAGDTRDEATVGGRRTDRAVDAVLPRDLALLSNKTGPTRLGFAALLLYFQHEGRFPQHRHEVPRPVVAHIAAQVGVAYEEWLRYDWDSRSISYHRVQIREALGYREASIQDADDLAVWLSAHVVATEQQDEPIRAAAYARLHALKIVPPTPDRLTRIVRSALHTYETTLQRESVARLTPAHLAALDALIAADDDGPEAGIAAEERPTAAQVSFVDLKADPGRPSLDSMFREVAKLQRLRALDLPSDLFAAVSPKLVRQYRSRVATESTGELRRHPLPVRATLVSAFCLVRLREITDTLADLLIQLVHKIGVRAEKKVDKVLFDDFKRVAGKAGILYHMAEASLEHPDDRVCDVVWPAAGGEQNLRDIVREHKATRKEYRARMHTVLRASYGHHYRRMLPVLLEALRFRSNNEAHRPVIRALRLLKAHAESQAHWYAADEDVPLDGVIPAGWRPFVLERDKEGKERVNRITYEILVLQALRDKLRCKEIWIEGADRFRNPDDDLPQDFEAERAAYYEALRQPEDADAFIADLQQAMQAGLATLHNGLPTNKAVRLLEKNNTGWIALTPLDAQPEPTNLAHLKAAVTREWPMSSLLDFLKEADLRIDFTAAFKSVGAREILDRDTLQRRLLLCLYGLGTNTGLKRMAAGEHGESYTDLLYVRRRFIHKEQLRHAIARVVDAIFAARNPRVWGEGTTACASDSKKFGAWDQNLMTEWHVRYRGRGVMIYWHVDKNAACIYSQLKTCSSSKVAAMIEGVLRHCTAMTVEKNYVDSHGQSEVAFAFTHLLGFQLMPRLKGIHAQKLYLPSADQAALYPRLAPVLTRAIDWDLIRQQYDQMIKYATALRLGTAETEAILRRFTKGGVQHPTYAALAELGKAVKTIFLCRYLHLEAVRREVQEGLNVVENWNSANGFIHYGKGGEIASNRLDDQEVAALSLHLLQICLVYINTLMIQQVIDRDGWAERLTPEDLRALTPLIYNHVTPYGRFRLDMSERLPLAHTPPAEATG